MGHETPEQLDSRPKWQGSPVYGYNSPNRGRHLRARLREAGFNVTEFSASYGNASTPEAVGTR